jgi:NAD+ synthase (glutamine-hydrolysing)
MHAFTLALAQIETKLGDTAANLESHLEVIARARRAGADLVVFPELSLTGYMLQDAAEDVALIPSPEDPVFRRLLRASRSVDLVVGFVERDLRQQKYVSAAYLSRGETVHIHRKAYLPTYGLFQDGRFFAAGDAIRAFDTRFGRFGLLVCEDFWHLSSPYLLWLDGAELLLLTSASPGQGLDSEGRLETARTVERIAQTYASLLTMFVAQTNRVGFEDGLCYWGGAGVVGPDGRWIAQGPDFEASIVLAEIDPDALRRARLRLPLLRDERPELVARTLNRILQQVPR